MLTRWRFVLLVALVSILIAIMLPDLAWAGPGGVIAKAVTRSFWGKLIFGLLVVVLLPFIVWVTVKEGLAARRTRRDLLRLAPRHPEFDWFALRERVIACFQRVHAAWSLEDMSEATEWMTDWYWQNQQVAHLDRWHREGLVNRCRVQTIEGIKPLYVSYRTDAEGRPEGSRFVAMITANMEDYLELGGTGEIVEGKKGLRSIETVWTFCFEDGRWVVSNIEESHLSLEYAGMANDVPEELPAMPRPA